jgi:electron transfer flavoprotein beta subunit
MKIFVCIKQVPDTETKVKISADKSNIDSSGIKWVINPYDEFAIEEAIKIRDQRPGSQVHVFTLGPKARAVDALRTALAMGADEGCLIHCDQPLDSHMTAQALATALKSEGDAFVVLTGRAAIDDNASSVPQMLAEILNIPHATVVSKVTLSDGSVAVERDTEGGAKECLEIKLPCLIAANKGLNVPRYASLPGIMKAKKKVLKELDFSSLDLGAFTARTHLSGFSLPAEKPPVKILSGDIRSQVVSLVKSLRDDAKVL